MSVICIAQANIADKDSLAAYRERAPEALKKYNGKILSASLTPETLEGHPHYSSMLVVLEFADAETARNWCQDPELSDIRDLRTKSGEWSIQLLAA